MRGLAHAQWIISVSGDFDARRALYQGAGDMRHTQVGHGRWVSVTTGGHLATRKRGRSSNSCWQGRSDLPAPALHPTGRLHRDRNLGPQGTAPRPWAGDTKMCTLPGQGCREQRHWLSFHRHGN